MKKAILGTKVGMTQMFREDGTMIPVTVVLAGPCPVVQKKTVEHDGYEAVQVAFKPIREKLCTVTPGNSSWMIPPLTKWVRSSRWMRSSRGIR